MSGWIKLHRSIKDWEWYDDVNVRLTFLHCLVEANFKDNRFKGTLFPRGSFPCGRDQLAKDIGITTQQLRTALGKLESTGEVTIKSTKRGTVLTVCNYDTYQGLDIDDQPTEQPTDNQQVTNNQPLFKKERKKEGKKVSSSIELNYDKFTNISTDTKSTLDEWVEYRKSIKKKLTQRSLDGLAKYSNQQIVKSIEASIMNGWTGVFPEKIKDSTKPLLSTPQHHSSSYVDSTKPAMS